MTMQDVKRAGWHIVLTPNHRPGELPMLWSATFAGRRWQGDAAGFADAARQVLTLYEEMSA